MEEDEEGGEGDGNLLHLLCVELFELVVRYLGDSDAACLTLSCAWAAGCCEADMRRRKRKLRAAVVLQRWWRYRSRGEMFRAVGAFELDPLLRLHQCARTDQSYIRWTEREIARTLPYRCSHTTFSMDPVKRKGRTMRTSDIRIVIRTNSNLLTGLRVCNSHIIRRVKIFSGARCIGTWSGGQGRCWPLSLGTPIFRPSNQRLWIQVTHGGRGLVEGTRYMTTDRKSVV